MIWSAALSMITVSVCYSFTANQVYWFYSEATRNISVILLMLWSLFLPLLYNKVRVSYDPVGNPFSHVTNLGQWVTWVNLLRKERGSPFLPPPWFRGFWQANNLVFSCWMWKVLPSSGMNTSARWSRQAFSPSSTDWEARFNWRHKTTLDSLNWKFQ